MSDKKNNLMTEGFYYEFLILVKEAQDVKKRKNEAKGIISHGYTFKVRHLPAEFYVSICSICAHPAKTRKQTRITHTSSSHLTATPSVNFVVNGHSIWYELMHENDEVYPLEEIVTKILLILKKKEDQEGVDNKTSVLKTLGLL